MIDHAKKVSSQRGTYANKDKQKAHWKTNEPVRSNIMGYYDTLSLNLNALLRDAGVKKHYCRQTGFTADHPDKWAKIVPLIQDIDKQYKNYSQNIIENNTRNLEKLHISSLKPLFLH